MANIGKREIKHAKKAAFLKVSRGISKHMGQNFADNSQEMPNLIFSGK